MLNNSTIKLREQAKALEEEISVFTDNAKFYTERSEGTYMVWDDTNGFLHVIRPNNSYYDQKTSPAIIETLEYDLIQYFISIPKGEDFETSLRERFVKTGLMTEDKCIEIVKYYYKLSNKLL